MKFAMIAMLLMGSLSTFAFSEIRCENSRFGGEIEVDLDLDLWGSNDAARATLEVGQNGSRTVYQFTMLRRRVSPMFNVEFFGSGVDLEINLWPDRVMRPLKYYDAKVRTRELGTIRMECQYWN